MSDLTEVQYLKCKPLYWSKRWGPHLEPQWEKQIWAIQFSTTKPKDNKRVLPDFYEWANDLTYQELNDHNKRLCANLWKQIK